MARITFIGNKIFDDDTLRGQIATEESAWWKFLSSNDNYDPDRLTFDREQLRRFYLNHGYADFRVVSAVAELTPDRESVLHHLHGRRGPDLQVRQGRNQFQASRNSIRSFCAPPCRSQDGDTYNAELDSRNPSTH